MSGGKGGVYDHIGLRPRRTPYLPACGRQLFYDESKEPQGWFELAENN